MEIIAIKKRKWKQKVSDRRQSLKEKMLLENIRDTDVKVALIQALIPEGLKAVNEKLQEEVMNLAGRKHRHGKENGSSSSVGSNLKSTIYLISSQFQHIPAFFSKPNKNGQSDHLGLCHVK